MEHEDLSVNAQPSLSKVISASNENLSQFTRKITSTATALVSNYPDQHVQNEVTPLFQRPKMKRNVFSFTAQSPKEVVRANLSPTEIQHRALSFLPDKLLKDLPESTSAYSLFQGFEATLPGLHIGKGNKRKHALRAIGHLNSLQSDTCSSDQLYKDKERLEHRHEMLGIRKSLASSEILEIDQKLSRLMEMRRVLLERIENFEKEEAELEDVVHGIDSRLLDVEEKKPQQTDETSGQESNSFMSESVYGKLNSPKARRTRALRRKSIPILHEHLQPGRSIRKIQCHDQNITGLDFDFPFGTMISASLDDTVRVWDLNTGKCQGQLEGHQGRI